MYVKEAKFRKSSEASPGTLGLRREERDYASSQDP